MTENRSYLGILVIAVFVLLCVGTCGGMAWLWLGRPPAYASTCRVLITDGSNTVPGDAKPSSLREILAWPRSQDAVVRVWSKLDPTSREQLSTEDALLRGLTVEAIESTTVIQMQFEDRNSRVAQDVIETLLQELRGEYGDAVFVIAPPVESQVR